MEETHPRFDWGEITKNVVVISIAVAVVAFGVPVAGALIGSGNTGPTAGNDLFHWVLRAVLWAMIIWRGSRMVLIVGDRIVDDMLVTAVITGAIWLVIKVAMLLVYQGVGPDGMPVPLLHVNDAFGLVTALLISWLGAKANQY